MRQFAAMLLESATIGAHLKAQILDRRRRKRNAEINVGVGDVCTMILVKWQMILEAANRAVARLDDRRANQIFVLICMFALGRFLVALAIAQIEQVGERRARVCAS